MVMVVLPTPLVVPARRIRAISLTSTALAFYAAISGDAERRRRKPGRPCRAGGSPGERLSGGRPLLLADHTGRAGRRRCAHHAMDGPQSRAGRWDRNGGA